MTDVMSEMTMNSEDSGARLRRTTGILLIVTAVAIAVGVTLSDPAIEEHHIGTRFIEQVEKVADRSPAIYAFQIAEVARGLLMAAVGVCVFLMLRRGTPGLGLTAMMTFSISGVFAVGTAVVGAGLTSAAQLYSGGHLSGIGAGSADVLAVVQVFTILHFGFFLAMFAALGIAIAVTARSLAWLSAVPRWQSRLGLTAGVLLCTSWLTTIHELLFLPFFFGGLLALVWLVVTGIRLTRGRFHNARS